MMKQVGERPPVSSGTRLQPAAPLAYHGAMMLLRRSAAPLAAASMILAGCAGLTREEAREALEEAQVSSQAAALTSSSIEISTSFTIGDAVESAAEELRAFIESQLPCAEVTVSGATLTVEYGALPGDCTYRGQRFNGTHSVAIMQNEMSQVVVSHTWTDFQNADVSVTGDATVTWDASAATRHVVHELTWTRLSDGRQGVGRGDRLQEALDEGIAVGFSVDGERSWSGESGEWQLDIDGVQMRWVDPVPQAGRYTLDTPYGKSITMTFERTAPTEIHVVVTGPRREFEFDVTSVP